MFLLVSLYTHSLFLAQSILYLILSHSLNHDIRFLDSHEWDTNHAVLRLWLACLDSASEFEDFGARG